MSFPLLSTKTGRDVGCSFLMSNTQCHSGHHHLSLYNNGLRCFIEAHGTHVKAVTSRMQENWHTNQESKGWYLVITMKIYLVAQTCLQEHTCLRASPRRPSSSSCRWWRLARLSSAKIIPPRWPVWPIWRRHIGIRVGGRRPSSSSCRCYIHISPERAILFSLALTRIGCTKQAL